MGIRGGAPTLARKMVTSVRLNQAMECGGLEIVPEAFAVREPALRLYDSCDGAALAFMGKNGSLQ
jgi:hypothetical protein